ncbi:undecaprenyl-phosphate glucose phosphotransferase [Prevotella cerevisiae]|uniref:Undecaprenyl-phosphate glucose phosphotransferase n=1 Tax=Segatella cerevisiae TaxID=2053716 RepID=A0ABT1BTW4_9BACT|nr:undecaprenyl-phosphate glucose phosphotransferase [Segatella cerevisiae]MCO6024409.1 undecaprenyl-phosphate glucose phosphotransferase [Segatella cerevisiae]
MKKVLTESSELIKWTVLIGDIVLFYVIAAIYLFLVFPQLSWSFADRQLFYLSALVGLMFSQYGYSSIIHRRIVTPRKVFRRVTELVVTVFVVTYLMLRLFHFDDYDGGSILAVICVTYWFLLFGLRFAERAVLVNLRRNGRNTRSVIFIGTDPALDIIFGKLIGNPSTGYRFGGYYAPADTTTYSVFSKLTYLGSYEDLDKKLESEKEEIHADEVYCSLPRSCCNEISRVAQYCDDHFIRFFYVPMLAEGFELNLRPEMLGDDMLVFSTYNMPLSLSANRLVKRVFDIVFALVSLVITLPFYPIIALIIKISSPGPVFFKQRRTGINGKEFTILKFRSMRVNADADKVQATKNDPRKFVFGDFMRKTDIDELPQFINVLKGEMSIVGPRPHMLIHTKLYSSLIRKYMVRHFVKPGITGWAQVTGFRGETKDLDLMKKRVRQDIWYLEHWSFWLDLYIIFLTIKSVFVHDKHAY